LGETQDAEAYWQAMQMPVFRVDGGSSQRELMNEVDDSVVRC
jgi:hypothetical protein